MHKILKEWHDMIDEKESWAPDLIWLQRGEYENDSHTWHTDCVDDPDIEEVKYVRAALITTKVMTEEQRYALELAANVLHAAGRVLQADKIRALLTDRDRPAGEQKALTGHALNELFFAWSEHTTELGQAISCENIGGFIEGLRAAPVTTEAVTDARMRACYRRYCNIGPEAEIVESYFRRFDKAVRALLEET